MGERCGLDDATVGTRAVVVGFGRTVGVEVALTTAEVTLADTLADGALGGAVTAGAIASTGFTATETLRRSDAA